MTKNLPKSMLEKTLDEQCETLAQVSWAGVWVVEGVDHVIIHTPGFACPVKRTELVKRATQLLMAIEDRY